MKKIVTLAFFLLLSSLILEVQAKNLRAYLNYTIFKSAEDGPYIETYLSVAGESVVFKKNDKNLFQSIIEVSLIFRQGEVIVDFDKYELFSPEIEDTAFIGFNFLDQQRYFIPEGNYVIEITISDKNAEKKPYNAIQPVSIFFEKDKVCFSGIELIDSLKQTGDQTILTKGGYDMIPMVHNFFPESKKELTFYTEIYNAGKQFGADQKFLISCYIKSFETNNILKDYVSYKKSDSKDIIPFLSEYDLTRLPSGNYKLVIELRDKQNTLIASNELFFQRSNPAIHFSLDELAAINIESTFASRMTNVDTLNEFIRCLAPIATEMERNFIYRQLDQSDLKTKQQFLYNFWEIRNPYNPAQAWSDYYDLVIIVNAAYKTAIQKGYDTDRGRVYLKYGPPNTISESYNEPNSYPYEIWQYYELAGNQRNKKFVFYAFDLITNSFKLLHSDAIGEISNYRWQVYLNNRWYEPYDLDVSKPPDIWGGEADDYYRNPR